MVIISKAGTRQEIKQEQNISCCIPSQQSNNTNDTDKAKKYAAENLCKAPKLNLKF